MNEFDKILFDLKSPIEEVRERAILSLLKTDDVRAIPILQKVVDEDKSVQIRYYAKKALHQLKKRLGEPISGSEVENTVTQVGGKNQLEKLKILLSNPQTEIRFKAIEWIASHNFRKAVPILLERLEKETDKRVKASLILTLGIVGSEDEVGEVLLKYLKNEDSRIRANTIEAIEYLGSEKLLEKIIPLLSDPDNRVKVNCAKALAKSKKMDIHKILADMVNFGDIAQKDSAAFALTQIATEKDLPLILKLLNEEKKTIKKKAYQALEKLALFSQKAAQILKKVGIVRKEEFEEDTVDFLGIFEKESPPKISPEKAFSHPDAKIRLQAIQKAISEDKKDVLPFLMDRLYVEDDSYVVSSLIIAVGKLGGEEDILQLKKYLNHPNHRIRASAVEALARVKNEEIKNSFFSLLQSEKNNRVLGNLLLALAEDYPLEVRAKLEEMVKSKEFKMKATAIYVIGDNPLPEHVRLLRKLIFDDFDEIREKAMTTLSILKDSGNETAQKLWEEIHNITTDSDDVILSSQSEIKVEEEKRITKPEKIDSSENEDFSRKKVSQKATSYYDSILKKVIEERRKNASQRLLRKKKVFDILYQDYDEKDIFRLEDKKYDSVRKEQIKPIIERLSTSEAINMILVFALNFGASDIHFEAGHRNWVRMRLEGILRNIVDIPGSQFSKMVSRLKVMCNMDITKNIPQDGRFSVKYKGKIISFRVSTFPTVFGDSVVLRILGRELSLISLDNLGFFPESLDRIRESLLMPHGLILITGPTGSGKSSTLYSLLNELNDSKKKIITIEDPVEVIVEGINQAQVETNSDEEDAFTFQRALRHILRQDPDVIMIGELRDKNSLATAVRAANTGHLVLSTLHSNSVVSAIMYLLEMGLSPSMFSSIVNFVLSQRLVRKLCVHCREEMDLIPEVRELLSIGEDEDIKIYQANSYGCEHCDYSGYKGRTVVYEFLKIDETVEDVILAPDFSSAKLERVARKNGMETIVENAIKKVKEGITSLEEILFTLGRLEK